MQCYYEKIKYHLILVLLIIFHIIFIYAMLLYEKIKYHLILVLLIIFHPSK